MINSKRLKLLERAYAAEINSAIGNRRLRLFQTEDALAEKLADDGYLTKVKETVFGATIEGYELTHMGRMAYCTTLS